MSVRVTSTLEMTDWPALIKGAVRQDADGVGASAQPCRALLMQRVEEAGTAEAISEIIAALTPLVTGGAREAKVIADVAASIRVSAGPATIETHSAARRLKELLWGAISAGRARLQAGDRNACLVPFTEGTLTVGLHRLALSELGDPLVDDDLTWDRGLTASAPSLVVSDLLRTGQTRRASDLLLLYAYQGWISAADLALHWEQWRRSYLLVHEPEAVWRGNLRLQQDGQLLGERAFTFLALCVEALALGSSARAQTIPHVFDGAAFASTVRRITDLLDGHNALDSARSLAKALAPHKLEVQVAAQLIQLAESAQVRLNVWSSRLGTREEASALVKIVRATLSLPTKDPLTLEGGVADVINFVQRPSAA